MEALAIALAPTLIVEDEPATLKHSRAANVVVTVRCGEGRLFVQVTDDGAGFGLQAQASTGIGVASLRARAMRLGGMLRFQAPAGGGTTLVVDAPLPD